MSLYRDLFDFDQILSCRNSDVWFQKKKKEINFDGQVPGPRRKGGGRDTEQVFPDVQRHESEQNQRGEKINSGFYIYI